MKSVVTGFKNGVTDFKRGLSIIFSKPEAGEGDRKLAKVSKIVMSQIPIYGKNTIRRQVIKSIESDMRKSVKKGDEAVESLIQNALGTPEYMLLLHKLGMKEQHLRILAMEAKKK